MIRLFIGTPGAGKSYGALKDLVEELVYGQRLIVTNLPVLIEVLNPYMAKKYPEWADDIHKRLRIITEEQTKEFYRYRYPVGDIGRVTIDDSKEGRHLPYGDHRGNGCLYIIDEAHIPFDSRAWADTGPELTYYNSQHRKLWDELVFITQFEKLIDIRVRGFVQEFCYFENHGLSKFMTWFQRPKVFTMEVHRKPPGLGSPPPNERRHYQIDLELAACYDTSAGVGISGRKKPETGRRKGVPFWLIVFPALAIALLLAKIPGWTSGGVMTLMGREGKKETSQPVAAAPSFAPPIPFQPLAKQLQQTEAKKPDPVVVKSYLTSGRKLIVTLSDGRILGENDGVLRMDTDYLYLRDGSRYAMPRGRPLPARSKVPTSEHSTKQQTTQTNDKAIRMGSGI